ncbi:MAG: molybdopterin cofactor-binding domain-containing protein [Bacteroidota bacterium]
MNTHSLSRRKFLQVSASSSVLLAVGCTPGSTGKPINLSSEGMTGASINQFITIATDGAVTLLNHRPEMGQGVFQSIPMILAEELAVDVEEVEIKQSEADPERYGRQMVVGSHSIQNEFHKMRMMGAAAKEMLIQTAADRWQVAAAECYAEKGRVIHNSSSRSANYGELVEDASKRTAPTEPALKSPADFEIIGQSIPRRDIPLKTNGAAIYGIDVDVPGMLYASVERSPVFVGTIKEYNREEVMKMPGVRHVLKTERDLFGRREGIAVLADTYWAAFQGRKALKVEWDTKGMESQSSETIASRYMTQADDEGTELFSRGDADGALSAGDGVIEAAYVTPYQAHVPMEPMNAIVSVTSEGAEFWGSTQNPNGTRSYLAKILDIPEKRVKINYTLMGGGFGRRSRTDVAEEAARLSQAVGAPVKVIWTREDDQTQGPFRACSLNLLKGKVTGGQVEALEHKVITQEIRNQTGDKMEAGRQIMGGVNTHYSIPNLSVRGVLQKHYIPISYWRAVYHSTNPFAHESFIDELAVAAGKDPLDLRLELLQDHPRFRRVLEEVRVLTDWDRQKVAGKGRGLAIAERSGAHFAMVVDVSRKAGKVKIDRITTVLDLGICVNPDTVRAQTEGSVIMGLTAALYGLTIENGAIKEQNFHTYPLLRYGQCPEIETFILPSSADPDGAGESGLPTVAPALTNALFDLTGNRIRKLPLSLEALV